ncbi:MAG: hypothetical protein IPH16_02310 [Haliscomenobacter sp.]|nr:hypothetical protein [Haliscomenobacter sp.]
MLKRSISLIALAVSLIGFSFTLTTELQPSAFQPFEGSWKGKLEYRDYTSSEWVGMPLEGAAFLKGNAFHLKYLLKEGKGYRQHYVYEIKGGTVYSGGAWKMDSFQPLSSGAFQLVMTQTGRDGNDHKPCTFRVRFEGNAKNLTITKEVRFDGETDFFVRNMYSLTR